MPDTKRIARRASTSMSCSQPTSGDVKLHHRRQDRPLTKPILALLDGWSLDEVDIPSEDLFELALHRHPVKQRPLRIRREPHQHIHIAIRAKLLRPRDAAEQRKLRHLPLPAELPELLLWNLDRDHAAVPSSDSRACSPRAMAAMNEREVMESPPGTRRAARAYCVFSF